MLKIIIPAKADLAKGIKKTYLDALFATKDNAAHQFDVQLFHGQAQEQLPEGSAVSGYFIRYSDNATVPLEGNISGNIASVTLTRACYNKPGQFALIIKVLIDDVISTVFYGEGSIFASSTDTYVDEENIIPSLEDLLAQIAVMEKAIKDANTASESANTAAAYANQEAEAARTAAGNASTAANKIDGLTVSAEASDTAGATITEVDGVKHIAFNLPQGEPGPQGPQGPKGADGTMSFEDLTDEQRESLRGPQGEPGQAPVKGTDYWTEEDKAGIVSDVLAALPNASGVSF